VNVLHITREHVEGAEWSEKSMTYGRLICATLIYSKTQYYHSAPRSLQTTL